LDRLFYLIQKSVRWQIVYASDIAQCIKVGHATPDAPQVVVQKHRDGLGPVLEKVSDHKFE
jgi:hypothetical protein